PSAIVLEALQNVGEDADPEVRAEVIRSAAVVLQRGEPDTRMRAISLMLQMAKPSLPGPTARSTHNGSKIIKVREAYDREFERYLVRLFLEQEPELVTEFLDSDAAKSLPVENRVLGLLAMGGREGAIRLADLAPANKNLSAEELSLLIQFAGESKIQNVLSTLLRAPETQAGVLEALVQLRVSLKDPKLMVEIAEAAKAHALRTPGNATEDLLVNLAATFRLVSLEPEIYGIAIRADQTPERQIAAVKALREIGANRIEFFQAVSIDSKSSELLQREAVLALAASRQERAVTLLVETWPVLSSRLRKVAIDQLTSSEPKSRALLQAIKSGDIAREELDAYSLEKLKAILRDDPDLAALYQEMSGNLRQALRLSGKNEDYVDREINLTGPFTVETWVKLDPKISNEDGILGNPDGADFNFAGEQFRIYGGADRGDLIVARKKIEPNAWTHVAVTRNDKGEFRIYINGELDNDKSRIFQGPFTGLKIGRTKPRSGTAGMLAEYRIWGVARSPQEIHDDHGTTFQGEPLPAGLIHYFAGDNWGKLGGQARIETASDFPKLLSLAEMRSINEKFRTYREYAARPGNVAKGRELFAVNCMVCHSVAGEGGHMGPTLNGAGAMGLEALLRSLLTPNAAVESGYYRYRVETVDDELQEGFLVSQDDETIVLRPMAGQDLRIPRKSVKRASFTKASLMPEGILESLEPQDAVDLLQYLQTLK
ncbi:MAG: LamG-like jellyroll fold domain-containing protein, partial [Limisphaerales bacterium]